MSDYQVTVYNPERAEMFEEVFGRTTVPVRSFLPTRANLPGKPNSLIYELDLTRVTPEERRRLVAHLAERFGLPVAEVQGLLDAQGVPILANDCVASGLDMRLL
jgi:hypothetical protein